MDICYNDIGIDKKESVQMKKDFAEVDKNFVRLKKDYDDIKYYNVLEEPFALEGLYKPKETGLYTRLPMDFMQRDDLNATAKIVMTNTAGGKVRFVTDSPYIVLHVVLGEESYIIHHMAATGVKGADMYCRDKNSREEINFAKVFIPQLDENNSYSEAYEFRDIKLREITINLPLYHNVTNVFVGLKEGCVLEGAVPYYCDKKIVFYGSSITQGGCASRPGMAYPAILSRRLECETINLGFSGAGQGESLVANFIADMDMDVFVMDYDHNATSVQHLQDTHYRFYEIIRQKNPDIPIIMMSAPVSMLDVYNPIIPSMKKRRMIIMESYIKGVRSGDENLYFAAGPSLLGTDKPYNSTVDGNHPTDYGFCQMADRLYPILARLVQR